MISKPNLCNMKQGWEIKKLGEVCIFCSGYTPKGNELNNEGLIPYFKVSDMNHRENIKYLTHTTLFLERGCKVYPKHTIVFPKNGAAIATNKKRILQEDSVIDLNTAGVIADKSIVYHEYLYFYLLGLDFRQYTRGGAVPTLDIAELKNKQIPVPPLAEQERIVAELDCLSGVIEKKKQQLKELDSLAQSIFYETFGDPITNEKGWEVKKLGDIASSQIGVTYKPENISEDNEGTVILRSGNIQDSEINLSDIVRINCSIKEQKFVQKGDILMCSRNGSARLVGKVAMIPELSEKMAYGAFMTIIRSNYQHYLFEFFKSQYFRMQLTSAQTSTINQITVKMLNDIKLSLPPLTLQQAFASKIEAIEKQKELIKQSIKEVETLFNSRMDYYFN